MKTPFKFLDAYAPEDKDAFFGRDDEVAELYDMVTKNRLILLYGQSGTGKTSLVQCGLAGRFDPSDWLPVTVRRQNDLNRSLERALQNLAATKPGTSTGRMLDAIFTKYLRPVYLIFDQLEELFILGEKPEIQEFTQNVRALLDAEAPLRIIFIIREEYLVHLYDLEKSLPQLFDRRLRVEPMSRTKLHAVLEGSFKKFNIAAEASSEQTCDEILRQLSGEKKLVQLPFLQVWLDRFYRQVFSKKYPQQEPQTTPNWQPVDFKRLEIKAFGDIGKVLEVFLQEQKTTLETDLKKQFPKIEDGAVAKILDGFVSEEGTKRPMAYEWKGEALHLEKRWADLFKPIPPEALGFCVRRLEQARLLRFTEEYVELAHDALAAKIDSQRSQGQRRQQELFNSLSVRYRDYQTGTVKELLTEGQLYNLEEYLPIFQPRMDAGMWRFVEESKQQVWLEKRAALDAERRKWRLAMALAAVFAVLAAVAFWQYRVAENAKTAIAKNALEARLGAAKGFKVQGQYGPALEQIEAARPLAEALSTEAQKELDALKIKWLRVKGFVEKSQNLSRDGALREAIVGLDSARVADGDAFIESQIEQAKKDLETNFEAFLKSGDALARANQCPLAADFYKKALLLKPENEVAKRKLEACR